MSATSSAVGAPPVRGRRLPRWVAPYLFLTPFLTFLVLFGLLPIGYAVYLGFANQLGDGSYSGPLANYLAGNEDFRFLSAVQNVGLYVVLFLPTLLIVVFLAAFLLDARPGRVSTSLRVLFYLPGSLVGSASVLVWLFMLDPGVSPFKPLFHVLGWSSVNAVVAPSHIAAIMALIGISTGAGGWIVIIYGALRGIPSELLDAGRVDGCSEVALVRFIKLPQVIRYAGLVAVLGFAAATQVFVEPTILYESNVTFITQTWSVNQLSYYYAFNYDRFGVSGALSVELFLVSLVIAVAVIFKTDLFRGAERR